MNSNDLEGRKIAFVPARSGSVRVVDKNIRNFCGHPLMSYAIRCAIESGLFDDVVCVTDSDKYAEIAMKYGALVPTLRPMETALELSPDIEWVTWALDMMESLGKSYEIFGILRPTSPFRQIETMHRAWSSFSNGQPADSLRAIRACSEHPGKMWVIAHDHMEPLLRNHLNGVPWHSNQTAALPKIYVQDASLELAWTKNLKSGKGIAGDVVIPFISNGYEGFDINTPDDWRIAEELMSIGKAKVLEF